MGLFSSKKKVTVDTTVSRAIEDNLLPDSPKQGAIEGIFSNDGQLVEHIMESVVGSIGVKAERMYRYGRDTYLYGVPHSTLFYSSAGKDRVQSLLTSLAGQAITFEYYQYGPLNNLHYGWRKLVESYGYDPTSNEIKSLSALKGMPVYLDDLQVVVAQATTAELENGSLEQWGTAATAGYTPIRPATPAGTAYWRIRAPTPFGVDATAATDYFRVSCLWQTTINGVKTTHTETFTFPMSAEDPNLDYFQVKYSYLEAGKTQPTYKYWTYRSGAGTYPTLDTVFTAGTVTFGNFFPLGYFRYNKTPTSSNPASTEFKHSKKLLKYLGMDYEMVRDAINGNPDIADVESALLMMAVPASTSNPKEQRYLFDFFKNIYTRVGEQEIGSAGSYSREHISEIFLGSSGPKLSLTIQDDHFKMAVQMGGLYHRYRAGAFGPTGSYSSSYAPRTIIYEGRSYTDEYDTVGTVYTREFSIPCYVYRHQVADRIYEEIEVFDLKDKYWISGKYTDTAQEGEKTLLIPLDHDITEHYSASDREELYARSLHYVFNTKIVTKVKWYQQGWFKAVLIIVAVVISILTYNPGPLMAAVAAGGMVLATFIATVIVKMVLFSSAFKLFVKAVGPKFAMVVAVIAAVYSLGSGMMNGGSLQGVPWGEEMLQVSSGISSTANEAIQGDLLGLQKDALEFQAFAEEQNALLEKANALLENQNLLSPFVVFGESPTDYYERTVHSGNIGVLGLDAVTNYCDIALTLPKLSQTLGESVNPEAFAFNNMG